MRLIGYVRVSTDKQAEEGHGIEVQSETIFDWADKEGHSILAFTSDQGISGSNGLDTRLGLARAMEHLRDGLADGLVVYRLDRLARDLVLQEQLLAEVRRMDKTVFSTSGAESGYLTDDPDDPSRKLIRHILGAVSEYERSMIALRLRSGRDRKARNGGFAYGSPPFGYRSLRGTLVPNEEEAPALERIMELASNPGLTLRDIAATLETEGFPAKRSNRWHPSTLQRIIARAKSGKLSEHFS